MFRLRFSLFSLLFAASLSAQNAPVAISIDVSDRLSAGDVAEVRYTAENTTDQTITRVNFDMSVGFGANITDFATPSDPAANCGPDPAFTRIGCTFPSLAPHAKVFATVPVHYPPAHYGLSFFVSTGTPGGNRTVSRQAIFYRDFSVISAADGGPGSFRQAILDTNAQCPKMPCRINFEIADPPPAEGWFTIAPASPLPPILAGEIAIDGERQTAISGDTNPRGPEVFLDGRGVAIADGLIISGFLATVRGLAIGGFPGNGILILKSNALIEHNYIGTDPTGAVAVPNGLRGVMGDPPHAEISGNVLSHNARSGLFLLKEANVHDNRIESNGASGIFLGGTNGFETGIVEHNVISGNHDFGVALPNRGFVEVRANSIADNGGGGIDVGLDGPTLSVSELLGPIAAPRMTVARFDAASGDTIIEGFVTAALFPPRTATVYLYANRELDADGFAEGERFLGAVPLGADGTFSLRLHEDLRGLYVDGNVGVLKFDLIDFRATSEFGPPLRAQ